jgi:hypothetical protein
MYLSLVSAEIKLNKNEEMLENMNKNEHKQAKCPFH